MDNRFLGIIAVNVGAVAALTISIYLWTLEIWWTPFRPVLTLGCAILFLLVTMGGLWFYFTQQQLSRGVGEDGLSAETRGFQRLHEVVFQLVLALIALMIVATWVAPQVRTMWVGYVSGSWLQLHYALKDPHPEVRMAACDALFELGVNNSKAALVDALAAHPEAAVTCLTNAKEAGRAGVGLISASLSSRWQRDIKVASEFESALTCRITKQFPTVDRYGDGLGEAGLLTCAMSANSDSARQCCAERIRQSGETMETLGNPEDFPSMLGEVVFSDLMSGSFGGVQSEGDFGERLGLRNEPTRRWALSVGCELLDPSVMQPEIVRGFSEIGRSEGCNLPEGVRAMFADPKTWGGVCSVMTEIPLDVEIGPHICGMVLKDQTDRSIAQASMLVHRAIRRMQLREESRRFDRASAIGAARSSSSAKEKRPMDDMLVIDVLNLTPSTESHCNKMVWSNPGANGIGTRMKSIRTTDCNRPEIDGETWGDYRRRKAKESAEIRAAARNPRSKRAVKMISKQTGKSKGDVLNHNVELGKKLNKTLKSGK